MTAIHLQRFADRITEGFASISNAPRSRSRRELYRGQTKDAEKDL